MTPEKEAELFATLSQIVALLRRRGEGIARVEDSLARRERHVAMVVGSRVDRRPLGACLRSVPEGDR